MGLLTIIYWILLVLILIGAFAGSAWPWYPRANSLVLLALFIIIGLKILKPQW
jgi:hypothetical protein